MTYLETRTALISDLRRSPYLRGIISNDNLMDLVLGLMTQVEKKKLTGADKKELVMEVISFVIDNNENLTTHEAKELKQC